MFKDRDLFVISAGALLAVFSLMLPVSLAIKVFLGLTVLIVSMVIGVMRFGQDRVPLEALIKRMAGYHLRPRKHTYQQPGYKPPPVVHPQAPPVLPKPKPAQPAVAPVTIALEGGRIYQLAGALLVVVGLYFIAWLSQGGAAVIARDIDLILGGVSP